MPIPETVTEDPPPAPAPPASADGGSPAADSWEAEADESPLTPDRDGDDEGCEEEDEAEEMPKIIKKKPPRVEDTRSKKEHINVVFIGHVGQYLYRLLKHFIRLFFRSFYPR